jgi:hypothetical protein
MILVIIDYYYYRKYYIYPVQILLQAVPHEVLTKFVPIFGRIKHTLCPSTKNPKGHLPLLPPPPLGTDVPV